MKAIVRDGYGPPDILALEEIAVPAVGDGDVLVRIRAASLNAFDWHMLRGEPGIVRAMAGLRAPKSRRLGADLAGVVEAVGKNVKRFRPGMEVFGYGDGAFAEYVAEPEDHFAPIPANFTFEQAAALPMAGISALQGLRDAGELRAGQTVLVNGASGGVGTFAVQIARALGAEVTGVCSTRNLELVRSLGAAHAVDYTREDFTRSGARYDLILDIADTHSLADYRRALAPEGILVSLGASGGPGQQAGTAKIMSGAVEAKVRSLLSRQKFRLYMARLTREDLVVLRDLAEAERITPVIDRTYRLEAVPEAIRYLEKGHARGKVVVAVS
ncbi:MAG TPA: NAD(P)-dependent alcohol dehydrogenase [Gemmatimonadales bacterium]